MEEQMKAKDEQLAKELQKGKQGRAGGKILSLLGLAVAAVGVILGGNLVMIVIGAVILGLGQMVQSGSKGKANQKAFEAIVPALMADTFEGVDFQPASISSARRTPTSRCPSTTAAAPADISGGPITGCLPSSAPSG